MMCHRYRTAAAVPVLKSYNVTLWQHLKDFTVVLKQVID